MLVSIKNIRKVSELPLSDIFLLKLTPYYVGLKITLDILRHIAV